MLLFLIRFLEKGFQLKVPSVFNYSSTRMLLAALSALVITIFCGPFFIRKLYELKIGQPVRSAKECPVLAELHKKKGQTPTMGGLLMLFSLLLSLVLWMDFASPFTWILLGVSLALGLIGAFDDFLKLKYKNSRGLRARTKFVWQVLIAALVGCYLLLNEGSQKALLGKKPPVAKEMVQGKMVLLSSQEYTQRLYLPFYKEPLKIGGWLAFLLVVLTIVGSSNAVNLTDGLDGLAAGCLVLVGSLMALVAFLSNNIEISRYLNILYIEGSGEIAVYLLALSGAALGFLWYNGHPAQVFMGDTGSLALGGILGLAAVLLKKELLLALIGGIFVIEALSVILQVAYFKLRRQRIFLCSPLHHHFEYKGWAETKVVLRFWIVGLLLAIIGLISLKFQ
ncbi:MAG: phospho-N-acetylmuramoyl-pentapeptide-transferase [Parachlamydiales bacterium]|jgi:phospho-N-acetylmuramoyl-pentapeptide-transferase